MKKFKRKIKQFLALWLKDELLEYISYKDVFPPLAFEGNRKNEFIDIVRVEQRFNIIDRDKTYTDPVYYEERLKQAKNEFFEEVLKHIKIEEAELFNPEYAFNRTIRMYLYIATKKHEWL